ncbi:hypothetical protein DSBG_4050 [Desulfosporosinus sp. BG]|nr:hypothetical protein DSBG_4050 [Desulfosporosinus sp. BG]
MQRDFLALCSVFFMCICSFSPLRGQQFGGDFLEGQVLLRFG